MQLILENSNHKTVGLINSYGFYYLIFFQSGPSYSESFPYPYLIIADLNYGDTICIDLESSNGYDATVIQWDRETNSVSRSWSGLVEWLMDTLDEGSLLVDYDGNEKDLDF
ncbi:SMI1/KNR4 family protein [Bacillus pseudomycoides]|uniref:SMI1/KNR4 family protein n=1 Tax=Bacillus pseudomycoides TaxID=64104 RepID=UPI00211D2F07|nr:SMI1/KNR4 family protein [Bacillus pseudomycoides]